MHCPADIGFFNVTASVYHTRVWFCKERSIWPMPKKRLQDPRKKIHILLVLWPVYYATSTDTYLDMRCWMCLVDEPKSGAI